VKDNFPEEYEFNEDMELSGDELADIPLTDESIEEDLAEFTLPEELPDEEVLPEADAAEEVLPEEELFHEDLEVPETAEEVAAAEQDMYDAGLTHPEDAVFYFDDNDTADEDTEDTELLIESEEIIPEAEAPKQERPVRKGRPKAKKGVGMLGLPHLFATLIWLLIILAIGTTLGRMLWVCAADVLAFGREEKDVTISITTDDTMESIAQKLKSAGLIRYPELFLLYADLTDVEEEGKITTGTFTLNTVYDYHALVRHMSPRSGSRAVVEDVLIPEGYNCRQIFALLEEKGVCKASDLEKWAAEGQLSDYWFLEGIERGHIYCLEGFLFPDTYDFYENSTPRAALEKMLDGFEYRFSEEMRDKIPTLNAHLSEMMRKNGFDEAFIAENQFDIRDVVNVASLIEKETANEQESYKIASVIYNRLFNWGKNPRYLNIDATIIYALGGKTDLTSEDMAVDSPYNTYTNVGMTPGPIANPGLSSMLAALDPESTGYYYYVLNPEVGTHSFSKTLTEHEKLVKKYYGG
jgi:UPF0755 protein